MHDFTGSLWDRAGSTAGRQNYLLSWRNSPYRSQCCGVGAKGSKSNVDITLMEEMWKAISNRKGTAYTFCSPDILPAVTSSLCCLPRYPEARNLQPPLPTGRSGSHNPDSSHFLVGQRYGNKKRKKRRTEERRRPKSHRRRRGNRRNSKKRRKVEH